jgi:cellulose synthase/poly-beta-1,6-N-acetylglucosamine synthase-like glycosyltransferase/peptidoglycan/xylan/chitin deacetylase (PgdA/CDA1 family)
VDTTLKQPPVTPSFPVFYDKSGKRLRRLILSGGAILLTIGAVGACVAPAMQAPTRPTSEDDGWAREVLGDTVGPLSDVGGGPFTRLLAVEQPHTGTGLPGPDPALLVPEPAPDDDGDGDGDGIPDDLNGDGVPDEPTMSELPDPPPVPPLRLIDPETGKVVRTTEPWETEEIADDEFAIDHFGYVPDRTLVLTFDDGPSATDTGKILDILSREHVPATFFVMGSRAVKHPDVLQRIIREGHTVGNHTTNHRDFDDETAFQNRQEIVQTDHIIRAAGDYGTSLFRIPTGYPSENFLAQLTAQQLGYLQFDFDLDTNDWRYEAGQQVPAPPLDGKGHVVLMHDAGGMSREGTVEMLPRLIAEARAQGYTFVPATAIVPPEFVPEHVSPTIGDRATLLVGQAMNTPSNILTAVFWFGVGSMVVFTLCYLLLSGVNEWRQRRKRWPDVPDHELPFVTVCLAAYNEEKVITRTLDMLRESDYPASRFEVIAVNDGSKDDTLALLRAYDWPSLRVVDQANAGKSTALNNALRHADPRSTVIITMDADTLFRKDTIRLLARHFITGVHGGKIVGAVAGHVKVGNRNNVLTTWQSLEYLNGICVIRMAEMMVGAVGIVPGACSAWRRVALERIGGFTEDTLAEDADAAMTFQRLGYAVLHDNHAICDTEAPETIIPLLKQRKRWMFGNFQVLWKNRSMLLRPRYGALGMITMPFSVAQLALNFVFMPILAVAGVYALSHGDWEPVAVGAAIIFVIHTVCAVAAIAISRESYWHLLVLPVYRPMYELMRVYLLYACAYRVAKGAEFAWDKLERRNSVVRKEVHGRLAEDQPNRLVLGGAARGAPDLVRAS